MKTIAIIKDGIVANTIVLDDNDALLDGWVDLSDISPPPAKGWSYVDGIFAPPPSSFPQVTDKEAYIKGDDYVKERFLSTQKQRLMLFLADPSTSQERLAKINAVLAWMDSIEAAWVAAVDNNTLSSFDPASFGEPPHTYLDILKTP